MRFNLLFICCFILQCVQSTDFGGISSVVLTSQDVLNGVNASTLKPAVMHQVYAVYASTAPNNVYASNVVIRGDDGTQFTVAELAIPKDNTGYILDENKILLAPITISDNNPKDPDRVPYTIYIVSTFVPPDFPVISAQLVNGTVDSGKTLASQCTVLSAEKAFMISDIDTASIGDSDTIYVKNLGYDLFIQPDIVMEVTKQTPGSSIMISGPIATLYFRNPMKFGFSLRRDGVWASSLTPGASTSLLSNGFLSTYESYAMPYANDNVLTRSYWFEQETEVAFNPVVGNYYPNQGDMVKFACVKYDGTANVYDCAKIAGSVQKDTCKSISLNVNRGTRTVEGPRFMIKIESTSGAITTSLFMLLISALVGVYVNV